MESGYMAFPDGVRVLTIPSTILALTIATEYSFKKISIRNALVAQSVKGPTSAQVMISWFTSSCPTLGSVLMAHSLEPAPASVPPSLSAPPLLPLCLSKISKNIKENFKKEE